MVEGQRFAGADRSTIGQISDKFGYIQVKILLHTRWVKDTLTNELYEQ